MSILAQISLPAQLENLERFTEVVSACASSAGFEEKRITEMQLAVEEALVNVFNYAYGNSTGQVELTCMGENGDFIIEIIDSGIPFDPLSMAEPDVTEGIGERKIGGLGILLIRRLMDDVRYKRVADKNVFDLVSRTARSRRQP
jgi:serine/threonine-protein kinase RsbW